MNQFQHELMKAEAKILSPQLAKFLKEVMKRREGKYNAKFTSVGAVSSASVPQYNVYLKTLVDYVRDNLAIDLDQNIEQLRFPQIFRLRVVQAMEAQLDRAKAAQEWTAYKVDFEKSIPQDVLETLSQAFQTAPAQNTLSFRSALEKLFTENQEAYHALVSVEQLKKMFTIKMLQSEIDASALFNEMDRLEYAVAEKMVSSTEESLWLQLDKDYRRLGRLFRMELASEDCSFMKNQSEHLSPDSLVRRLKFLGYGKSFKADFVGFQPYEAAAAFYNVAELRDEYLLKNTLRFAQETGAELVILVSGGFHAEGIQVSLEKQGYSFSVIRPAIAQADQNQLYYKAMNRANSNVLNRGDLRFSSEQAALALK